MKRRCTRVPAFYKLTFEEYKADQPGQLSSIKKTYVSIMLDALRKGKGLQDKVIKSLIDLGEGKRVLLYLKRNATKSSLKRYNKIKSAFHISTQKIPVRPPIR